MSVDATNQALLVFLGIPPSTPVLKIEIIATADDYPRVIVTQQLTEITDTTTSRLFYLVPYSQKP